MSNHSSHIDIPIIAACLPENARMFAHKNIFNYPLIGWSWALKLLNNIKLDDKNKHTLKQSYTNLANALIKDQPYWVSPEGYNESDKPLTPFKNGMFKLAREKSAIIIPFAIHGAKDILNIQSLKNIQINTNRTAHIKFGDPIDSQDFDSRVELRNHTYDIIQQLLSELSAQTTKNIQLNKAVMD